MEQPLVSIAMIVKNGEKFLSKALNSLVKIEYPNLELQIQDGSSTDKTLNIIGEFIPLLSSLYTRGIHLISEKENDVSDAMFRVLKRCNGEYIACCWSDETLTPYSIRLRVAAMEQRHSDVVYGDHLTQTGTTKVRNQPGPFNLTNYLNHAWTPPFCTSMFRTETLNKIGLHTRDWGANGNIGEFELWCRLSEYDINYVGGIDFATYAVHPEAYSCRADYIPVWSKAKQEFVKSWGIEKGLTEEEIQSILKAIQAWEIRSQNYAQSLNNS